jgi:hypothetical protein
MSTRNRIPGTVEAHLGARLTPFSGNPVSLEDLDVEASPAVSPHMEGPRRERSLRVSLVNDLKLLFAALGAGGSAVPLGDNGRTAHLLATYAASLRDH